jgi:hypothetical protein
MNARLLVFHNFLLTLAFHLLPFGVLLTVLICGVLGHSFLQRCLLLARDLKHNVLGIDRFETSNEDLASDIFTRFIERLVSLHQDVPCIVFCSAIDVTHLLVSLS